MLFKWISSAELQYQAFQFPYDKIKVSGVTLLFIKSATQEIPFLTFAISEVNHIHVFRIENFLWDATRLLDLNLCTGTKQSAWSWALFGMFSFVSKQPRRRLMIQWIDFWGTWCLSHYFKIVLPISFIESYFNAATMPLAQYLSLIAMGMK